MVWFIFALFSAIFRSIHEFLTKKFLDKIDKYVLASGSFLITGILLFLYSYYKGFPVIGDKLFLAIISTTMLNVIMVILTYTALKITDLSLAAPISSFTPLFLILTSLIILKEVPNKYGILGIFLVVIGNYVLNFKRNKEFVYPIKQIFNNKGVFYLFIVAFLASISINFDKLVVLNSDASFGTSLVYLLLGTIFLSISLIKNKDTFSIYYKNFSRFLGIGLFIFLGSISINLAYQLQKAAYVSAINRMHILLAILYGGFLLKEKNLLIRFIGGLLMVLGVITITIFG